MAPRGQATVNLDAVRHNLQQVRLRAPNSRVYAAVKADAYGHGAVAIAAALCAADGLAVASLDEALVLREAGVRQPIALLSEPLDTAAIGECVGHGFEPVIFESGQLERLRTPLTAALPIWVKLDTGMHRLGFPPQQAARIHAEVERLPHVRLAGWMTHLACADDVDVPATAAQLRRFESALEGLPGARSIANSAGICVWPASHRDMVRPGIMLYGASPLLNRSAAELDLRPAMTLRAPLISRSRVAAGEPVGYGATWRAQEELPLGVIAIGYGDGYPRHAPSGTPVLLGGMRVPMVGRVSMDMITVDLRNAPNAQIGDQAVLWGEGLPADEIARQAGTIAYELFCRLSQRVRFQYKGSHGSS